MAVSTSWFHQWNPPTQLLHNTQFTPDYNYKNRDVIYHGFNEQVFQKPNTGKYNFFLNLVFHNRGKYFFMK